MFKMNCNLCLQENYRMGGSYKWPSVDDVVDYRCSVRNMILKVIEDMPLDLPITMESPWVCHVKNIFTAFLLFVQFL